MKSLDTTERASFSFFCFSQFLALLICIHFVFAHSFFYLALQGYE
jgi:hypothetical protein